MKEIVISGFKCEIEQTETDTPEKIMKKHLVVPLAVLAISFALPAIAQEKEETNPFLYRAIPASPQLAQELE